MACISYTGTGYLTTDLIWANYYLLSWTIYEELSLGVDYNLFYFQ